jgi:hypothetical protein
MATLVLKYADGREGRCYICFFPGAFEEALRIATMYGATAIWCLPLDVWGML